MDTIQQKESTLLGLAKVRERLAAKLDSATNDDWRLIFNALAVEGHVTEERGVEIRMDIPLEQPLEEPSIVSTRPRASTSVSAVAATGASIDRTYSLTGPSTGG